MPIRIYSLAKQLKLDSKVLVDICNEGGCHGKGLWPASLTDEEMTTVMAFINRRQGLPVLCPTRSPRPGQKRRAAPLPSPFRREDYIALSGGTVGPSKVSGSYRRRRDRKTPIAKEEAGRAVRCLLLLLSAPCLPASRQSVAPTACSASVRAGSHAPPVGSPFCRPRGSCRLRLWRKRTNPRKNRTGEESEKFPRVREKIARKRARKGNAEREKRKKGAHQGPRERKGGRAGTRAGNQAGLLPASKRPAAAAEIGRTRSAKARHQAPCAMPSVPAKRAQNLFPSISASTSKSGSPRKRPRARPARVAVGAAAAAAR